MEKILTNEDLKKCIENVFNSLPKKQQTFKLYCYSEKCLEEFDRMFKEEVEKKYGKKTSNQST